MRPWRQSLDLFQEHYWQQACMRLTPDSYDTVAAMIERRVNDPSCHAHGPIQPDATGLPPGRRLEDVLAEAKPAQAAARPPDPTAAIVVTPEPDNVLAATAEGRNQLRLFARKAALLEQKRIGSSDEEVPRYEYFLYDNLLRRARGQTLRTMQEYWTRRNDALDKVTLLGEIQPPRGAASESKTADASSPETPRSHNVNVVPNASGPPESGSTSAAPAGVFVNGVEVAGPGPETTQSYRDKVKKALETLDPRVARWWKAPSVEGQVRSRSGGLSLFKYASYLGANDQPFIVVNENFAAGQTAQAIIAEAQGGLLADSIGAFYKKYKFAQTGDWKEFREWQQRSVREAARLASILAELYINSIATLTPSGDLVVTIGDIAENGPHWNQLLSILPLLGYLPIGAIILKLGKRQIQLPKKLAKELESLTADERKLLLARAAAAKTDDEAKAIIERGVKAGRAPEHHIATSRNEISALRGGPWTPRFEKLFNKAGMTLEDVENKVRLPGHKGPHPKEYHQEIYERLSLAVENLSGEAYKRALLKELEQVAKEIKTPGTKLNRLLTQ